MTGYVPSDEEVETAFHEFASMIETAEPGSYPDAPEFADWREARDGFLRWLAERDGAPRDYRLKIGPDTVWESMQVPEVSDWKRWGGLTSWLVRRGADFAVSGSPTGAYVSVWGAPVSLAEPGDWISFNADTGSWRVDRGGDAHGFEAHFEKVK